ncbi:hypothetical protein EBA01_00710 [Xanthomonas oryzae pv. oryzae]|nr:hypothetical protein C0L89_00715 [Xanthomonas oryzae pv. oryzae]AVU01359.1 hypothetical protein C0L90_00720 [Xanthomonas oryzae pv. oryzae]QBI10953.1 hypothetical protein EYR02_00735 [Xanthomonas oryzae pv. oryzae]QBI14573.1 hypothetical protein EYR03_00725 [Xanthomonas oryzae pv. oryzae]QBN23444.1 hypothetical protein EBA00_00720 [Xanthomonas oryzae pv. oryzae]
MPPHSEQIVSRICGALFRGSQGLLPLALDLLQCTGVMPKCDVCKVERRQARRVSSVRSSGTQDRFNDGWPMRCLSPSTKRGQHGSPVMVRRRRAPLNISTEAWQCRPGERVRRRVSSRASVATGRQQNSIAARLRTPSLQRCWTD